jgi:Zn-dependent protease
MIQGDASSVTEIATLVGVILLHELGHAIAMLAFRYKDVRVFFIPFFGAAASGRRHGVARWKQGLVLMMGPLPGLVLGCALLLRGAEGLELTVALQLVAINAFNLLPIAPFDGGQLFNLVLFSRHRHVEVGFLAVAALAVIGLALLLKTWIFGVLGLFMLLSIPVRKQVLAAANELKADNLPEDPHALDEPQRRRVFDVLWSLMSEQWRGKPAQQAGMMEQVHASASQRPLSVDASVAIGALWIAGVVLTAIAVTTVLDARSESDEPIAAAQWQRYYNVDRTFSIELPAQPVESKDPQPNLLVTYRNREYGVVWSTIGDEEGWKNFAATVSQGATRVRDLDIPDSEAAFVMKTKEGMYGAVRIVRRGQIGFLVMGGAFIDTPDNERAVRSFRVEPTSP